MIAKGYKQTEVGIIPEDWSIVNVGDILSFKNGLNKESEFFGYGTPIVNYMDVFNNQGLYKKNIKGKVFLNSQEKQNFSARKGDVFFTRTSETQEEIGISAVLLEKIEDCVFSGFILRGRPVTKKIIFDYYKYCFTPQYIRNQIISTSSFTTRALTNGRYLSNIILALPPTLKEQKAIAKVLTDTDNLIQGIEDLIAKKKAIKKGAMQQLLTPPNKGGKRLPGFSGEWVEKSVSETIEVSRGGSPRPIQDFITNSQEGINWIKIGDTSKKSKYISSSKEKIIPEGANYSRKVFKGDFLLSNSMSFGRPYIMKIDGCIHDGWLVLQKYQENFDREFLYYTLISENVFHQYLTKASGSGVLNLNKELVKTIILNSPPTLKEQNAIATILSDMDKEIEALETKKEKYIQVKKGLAQELLTGKTRLV